MMKFILPDFSDKHYQRMEYHPQFNSCGQIDISDLLKSFQRVAGEQIERLGLGDDFRNEHDFYYVVCRIKGYFLEKIQREETYTFVTFPVQATTLQLYRYAYLLDSKGKPVFYLISLWVLMNQKTRRLQSAKVFQEKLKEELPDIDSVKPLTDEKLYEMDISELEFHEDGFYVVAEKDIDTNHHMNNTVYMKIAQEKYPNLPISIFEIDFERECYLNETISLETFFENHSAVVIGKKSDQTLSFIVRFLLPETN